MANYIALIVLALLFLWSFFSLLKSSVNLTVTMKNKKEEDETRFKMMDNQQSRIITHLVNIIIISGCMNFFLENVITTRLTVNLVITYLTMNFIICMHELGHYYFGKRYKLNIEAFTVGIGTTLFKTKIKDTTFTLKLIPFLGFVKPADKDEYTRLNRGQKILFCSGGLLVNYLFYVIGVVMIAVGKGYSVLFGIKTSFILLWTSVINILHSFSLDIIYSPEQSFEGQVEGMLKMSSFFSDFWVAFAVVNLLLFLLNLLPISPLDGGHIAKEVLEKTLEIFRLPKKLVVIITSIFVFTGLAFMGSRFVVNNGWAMINDLRGRWIEFTLWLVLLFTVMGYFTQRKLDKIKS